jgi:hypothetical protein
MRKVFKPYRNGRSAFFLESRVRAWSSVPRKQNVRAGNGPMKYERKCALNLVQIHPRNLACINLSACRKWMKKSDNDSSHIAQRERHTNTLDERAHNDYIILHCNKFEPEYDRAMEELVDLFIIDS